MPRTLIEELKANPDLVAECPGGHTFRLKDAVMFSVGGPVPKDVQKMITALKADIAQRRKKVAEDRKALKGRVERATVSANLGRVLEKVAPAVKGFGFDPGDCRSLFEPIDYIVFQGLSAGNGQVDSLVFTDIKAGGAGLNDHQRQIKTAVEAGKVELDIYRGEL